MQQWKRETEEKRGIEIGVRGEGKKEMSGRPMKSRTFTALLFLC
jgi:hypothetical protein